MLHLKRDHNLDPKDIVEVHCRVNPGTYYRSFEPKELKYAPPNGYAAITSIPYLLAVALVEGRVTTAEVSDEKVKDPRVLEMARKVTRTADPSMVNYCGGHVTIRMKDGHAYEHHQNAALGSPDLPAPRETIEEKFRVNTDGVLSQARAQAAIDTVAKLEELNQVSELMCLLQKD